MLIFHDDNESMIAVCRPGKNPTMRHRWQSPWEFIEHLTVWPATFKRSSTLMRAPKGGTALDGYSTSCLPASSLRWPDPPGLAEPAGKTIRRTT